jgi:hypothetical protein
MLDAILVIVWLIAWGVSVALFEDDNSNLFPLLKGEYKLIYNIGVVVYSMFWPIRLIVIGVKHYLD